MRAKTIYLSFASMAILLISLPGSQALPKWLQPKDVDDGSGFAPRGYSVYEPPPVSYQGYQYGGNGPLPTIQDPPTTSVSSTSLSSASSVAAPSLSTATILSGTSNIILFNTTAATKTEALPTGSSSATASWSIASDPDAYNLPSSLYNIGSTATTPTAGSILTSVIELSPTSSSSESTSDGSLNLSGSSEAGSRTTLIPYKSSTASEAVSAIGTLTSISGTSISSGRDPVTPSVGSTIATNGLSQGYESSSIPTTIPIPLSCNHNNCLREFIRSSTILAGFCATYTTTIKTATTDLPVSMCHDSPVEISSACSCLSTGSLPPSTPLTPSTSAASLASSEICSTSKTSGSSYTSLSALGASGAVSSSIYLGGSSTVIGIFASRSSTLPHYVSSPIVTSLAPQSTAMSSSTTVSGLGITTFITSTVVIIASRISGTRSAGIPQSSSPCSSRYTNTTTLPSTTSFSISNTTKYRSTAAGAMTSALGSVTPITPISIRPHNSFSWVSPASHRTFSHTKASAASRPTGTSTLRLSTFSIGIIFPYSSGFSTPPFYTISNSSTGWFPTATGFVTSTAFEGLSTSSVFPLPTYKFSNASSTSRPTTGSYPITSVAALSTSSSISSVVVSCTQSLSAPYTISNWTLCTAPTGTESISISSIVGPLTTASVFSASISGGIPSSSTAAGAPFPTLSSNSSYGQTAFSTSLPHSSTSESWSSIFTSKLLLTYSVGPLSSGSLPSTNISGSTVASTATSSGLYLVSNSTSSIGPTGTGVQVSSTYSNGGVLTPTSSTFPPLPSNPTSPGGSTGTGYLSSSSSSTRGSGSDTTLSSIYTTSSAFSPSDTGSFSYSTSLNDGTLTSKFVPSPTVSTSTPPTTSSVPSSGSSSNPYSLPSSLISPLLPSTLIGEGGVTSSAPSSTRSTDSEAPSAVINSGSSASDPTSSTFSGSTLSVSYYDPDYSSTSKAVVSNIPYYIPPSPPPGYYPRRLAKTQRK